MPDTRSTRAHGGRGLTTAGLIAVTAATLLMMAWAILPTSALADGTFQWGGQGFPNQTCTGTQATMLWIFNDNGSAVPTSLTINGQVQSGSWDQQGQGAYHFTATIGGTNYPPVSASVTYTGTLGSNSVLTLSHCDGTRTTTTTKTSTTTTGTTTTGTTTTGTTTTGTTTTGTTTTGTTTTGTTTTTTTGSQTVGPTTVGPTDSPSVAPTTVQSNGTAFTGPENVVPVGAIALMLMTSGSALLWAGSRRKRDQDRNEE